MKLFAPFALLGLLVVAGCQPKTEVSQGQTGGKKEADSEGAVLLKKSMDTYAAFKTFQADCNWVTKPEKGDTGSSLSARKITYEKPNKFKVVTKLSVGQLILTTVSDGEKLVEYSTDKSMAGHSFPAPADLATASSMVIKHPMFAGSLLNMFFSGSSNYYQVVDNKKPAPSFGATEKAPDGSDAQVVKFYGMDTYGNVEMLIGLKTGLVYRIVFDNEPLREMIDKMPEQTKKGKSPVLITTETYANIQVDKSLDSKVFDTTFPAGVTAESKSADSGMLPSPFKLGTPAPDFTLKDLNGKTVSLSSFRGQTVFIDFWATWCPPCREGLPITDKLHQEFKDKGLAVLTVSDEDRETVSKFVTENKYTFNSYLDGGSEMQKAYKVESIPTTVIIDKAGKIASYTIGLLPEGYYREELAKVGFK